MAEIKPPYVDVNIEDMNKFYEDVIKDDTLKDTYMEFCYSILGYMNTSNVYNFPIFLFRR